MVPRTYPSHFDFDTLPEEDRSTAIGNMHKKDHVCGSKDMLAERQTHTQMCSLQYFATDPTGEVIITPMAYTNSISVALKTEHSINCIIAHAVHSSRQTSFQCKLDNMCY